MVPIINFFNKLTFVLKSKWIWVLPSNAPILIYDRSGSDLFLNYFNAEYVEILDVRGEFLNIPILVIAFFCGKTKNLFLNYQELYIKTVKPHILITYIDNNLDFIKLNAEQFGLKKIFVQNGVRAEETDVLGKLSHLSSVTRYKVDYMFFFGEFIAKKYLSYIEGEPILIGSFKNNMIPISHGMSGEPNNTIVFISQFRAALDCNDVFVSSKEFDVKWQDFYRAETVLMPLVAHYAKSHDIKLTICACSTTPAAEQLEFEFYNRILSSFDWGFVSRKSPDSSYACIDSARYIIFIDSTLGYEALARGKRVAAFSIRGQYTKLSDRTFAWPAPLPDTGLFWTNVFEELVVKNVLDYITTVSDDEWKKLKEADQFKNIMNYDFGNSLFLNLMRELNVPLTTASQLHSNQCDLEMQSI